MSSGIDGSSVRVNLPPLNETFPVEKYPRRELMGTGFTAQSVRGPEAEACSATVSEMLMEWRSNMLSSVSSEGSASQALEVEPFVVPDLPLPEGATQDGLLILRNEALFPGMVGVSLPGKDTLWVREDGTFNFSGFFRRQIPKFEIAAVVAAATNMSEFLDVYHATYRPALEAAAGRQQFKVMRTVIEAGMKYYPETDSPQRMELMEVRRRVLALRSQIVNGASSSGDSSSTPNGKQPGMMRVASAEQLRLRQDNSNDSWVTTEEVMEMRRRLSDTKRGVSEDAARTTEKSGAGPESIDGLRRNASEGVPDKDRGNSLDGSTRSVRSSSGNERSSKIAEQIVTGAAPKQKSPFRLWKSDIGGASYDKSRPS